MKYRIFGTFSPVSKNPENISHFQSHKNGLFSGNIEIREDGSFSGHLEDCYGKSKITGTLLKTEISFEKTYSKENGETFFYNLYRRDSLAGYSGFWGRGSLKIPSEANEGQAICAIVPLST